MIYDIAFLILALIGMWACLKNIKAAIREKELESEIAILKAQLPSVDPLDVDRAQREDKG